MRINEVVGVIDELFQIKNEEIYYSESGVTYSSEREVKKIGYCVNLTLETVDEAVKNGVDMMITHHDAWDEIFGLKEACIERLKEYGISHYYNHLPLDDCEFGTNDSLLRKLNLNKVEETHQWEGLHFGRVGECSERLEFSELVEKIERVIEEPVRAWKFNDSKVKRVGLVCGNGAPTECLKESVENNCDVYITGECNLYTIQYAQLKEMNLIIGSHTFTEIFGVESLAFKLEDRLEDVEIVRLQEGHYEANI